MNLTLTPLPATVSAKSLLPNTDPRTGIVTATARPTRHAWAMSQTILAALGVRLDIVGAGRRYGEDLTLLTAWLTAHDTRMIVIRHATNLTQRDLLDDLWGVANGVGASLALTCDETVGTSLADWVRERSGNIDPSHEALLDRLGCKRREAHHPGPASQEEGRADTIGVDFPPFLPRVDFYKFRARCRDLLTPQQFALVDACYLQAFSDVAANPFRSSEEASHRIAGLVADTDNPGVAITRARAAQAAMFTQGRLLKVNINFFLNTVRDGQHRRLTAAEVNALHAYRTPWRPVAAILRDAGLSRVQITSLQLADVTSEGHLGRIDHEPLLPQAQVYLRAQRTLRTLQGAAPGDRLINESERYIAQAQRRAAVDLNLPMVPTQEPKTSTTTHRWKTSLGVTLLPLTGLHLPATTTEAGATA